MQNTSLRKSRRFQKTNRFSKFANANSRFKILFTLALFLFASLSASAAVTIDGTSSARDSSPVGLSSMNWTHTIGSGTEQALYVGVSSATTLLPVSLAPSLLSVEDVTYNGVAMTKVGSVQSPGLPLVGNLVSKSYVDIYRLINPPSGAHSVVVRFSTLGIVPLDVFVNQAVGGAISYNGVDPVTPNGFFTGNAGFDAAPGVTVNGGTNQDLIMDVLASSPNAEDFTAAGGQTLRWEGNFTPTLAPTFDLGAGSTKTGDSAVTMSWTLENSNRWALGGLAIRAASNPPSVFTVDTNADNESDGCAVGNCTLREAVNDANNTAQSDTIVFAPNVAGSINLTAGQLVASSDITINGPGARNLAVRGDNNDRVFLIATPLSGGDITVNISGLTVSNGFAQPVLIGSTTIGDGGGILNGALLGVLSGTSTLNLTEVNVSNNRATTLGGGIATRLNARTNITRSLVSNNISNATVPVLGGDVGGGGISNIGGTTTISNTTVTNNNSLAAGGGILNAAGRVNLTNSTISHNRSTAAGGGVASVAGVLQILGVTNLRNTIIANNNDLLATSIAGRDVFGVLGSFNSLGNNLIGSNFGAEANLTASVFVGTTPQPNAQLDLVGGVAAGNQLIDPLLGALQNNGGATNTRLPAATSPAIDRGNNCVLTNACTPNPQNNNPSFALTLEQRGAGFPRLLGTTVDIGATEGIEVVTPIVVNSLLDNENDGCAVGACTLREAINDANATSRADTINLPNNLTGTIFLTAGQLIAYTDMTINGPGARNLIVNGSGADRVFLIATPISGDDITVSINNITVENGSAQPVLIGSTLIGDGGGILNGALLGVLSGTSTLNLSRVSVSNSKTTTLGGGIANRLNAVTNVYRSLVSNNSSDGVLPNLGGGGISNTTGTMTLINTTISDNDTLAAGGGILNTAGTVNLINDTISNNRSTLAGGGVVSTAGVIPTVLGVTNIRNTIIANNNDLLATNVLGRDVVGVLGSFNSLGNNLIGSSFGAEANFTVSVVVGTTPQPNVNGDIVANANIGNQVIDPKLGALQNNGGLTDTRLPLTGSPAIDRGNNCVLTNTCSTPQPFALSTEQRGAGYPRLQNSRVDIGAVEALAPTASGTVIAGRVTQTNNKGIFRAVVSLTDRTGAVRAVNTSFNGSFRFDSVDAQQTYILHVQVQDYDFATQVVTPTADLLDLRLVGIPSGGGLSSF